jgi:hypothetical protein
MVSLHELCEKVILFAKLQHLTFFIVLLKTSLGLKKRSCDKSKVKKKDPAA